ncbi:MAG: Omp28-related outer membrane protein [Chitinophagales bacterium]|nr:Omp28-related outer membrane protein [Chitinophagales bacterium]
MGCFFSACREVGPDINLGNNENSFTDTSYVELPPPSPESKRVVLEEFTGVQCVNCPAGHQIIKTLSNTYGDKLIVVAYHTDFLGEPFSFSKEDMRTEAARQIQDFLIFDGYKPAAAIDRYPFNQSQNSLLYNRNTWSSRVQQQIGKIPPVNLALEVKWEEVSRKITVGAELRYTSNISGKQRLTLLLTEDSIITPQLNVGNVIDTFYQHQHIQRIFISNITGDDINYPTEAGRVIKKYYQSIVPEKINIRKAHIVGFVHRYLDSKEILQGAIAKIP